MWNNGWILMNWYLWVCVIGCDLIGFKGTVGPWQKYTLCSEPFHLSFCKDPKSGVCLLLGKGSSTCANAEVHYSHKAEESSRNKEKEELNSLRETNWTQCDKDTEGEKNKSWIENIQSRVVHTSKVKSIIWTKSFLELASYRCLGSCVQGLK